MNGAMPVCVHMFSLTDTGVTLSTEMMALVVKATRVTSTASTASPACPKCGTNQFAKRSCCGRGGAWFGRCGRPGDSEFEHTWMEGIRACESKLKIYVYRHNGANSELVSLHLSTFR